MKVCPKCDRELPASDFCRNRHRRDGLNWQCRACANAHSRATYRANPENTRIRVRAYRTAHPEETKVRRQAYKAAHADEIKAKARAYDATHRDQKRAYYQEHRQQDNARKRVHYLAHQEELKAYGEAYRATHLERSRQRARDYRQAHPIEVRTRIRAWQTTHPERTRELSASAKRNRRHRIRSDTPTSDVTTASWQALLDEHGHRCFWCDKESDRLEMDHVIPVVQDGKHLLSNLVPACVHCNRTKLANHPLLFLVRQARTV